MCHFDEVFHFLGKMAVVGLVLTQIYAKCISWLTLKISCFHILFLILRAGFLTNIFR